MSVKLKFADLPVAAIADEVSASLAAHPRLIVTAPPGAGKSTLLPLTLLEALPEGRILMLEPRRIAAIGVAERMAEMLGERVGHTVGYRVRFDTKVSAATRIEVITEGVMERLLLDDPALEGVAVVIFDEFHERSLSSDLSLALAREIQGVLRPDLRILLMSATIDADSLSRQLDAPVIRSDGRCHAVSIVHCGNFEPQDCAETVAGAVRRALRDNDGDILAFLPGQAEILRCRDLLETTTDGSVELLTLYGLMSPEMQRRCLRASEGGRRRVVLASPIAETSLTIDGISVVVDSGLYRTPVYQPSTGLSRLATTRVSMDMAVQRAGRAGRLREGVCYRLWSAPSEARLAPCRQPEILTADLASMMLTAAVWGEADPQRLPWVTPPPPGHIENARQLLRSLGALDPTGRLTAKGKRLAALPCHPRIASMLTEAAALKAAAADLAALLEEKDPVADETDADITTRFEMLRRLRRGSLQGAWRRIDSVAAQYRRLVGAPPSQDEVSPYDLGRLIGAAYPERIAMRESSGAYRLAAGGRRVELNPADDLARFEFLAVASMGTRIFLAAPVAREHLETLADWTEVAVWNSREGRAVVRDELRFGRLCLASRQSKGDTRSTIASVIAAAAPKEGLTMFDFNDDVAALQLRIAVASAWHPELKLPDVSTEAVLAAASEWLPLYIGKATTVGDLRKISMQDVILSMLDYEQQQALDRIAPVSFRLPSGRTVKIRYRRGAEAPVISARLQDCFGLTSTPTVDSGQRPVLMELLSPGFKPVQLTQDMEGFWRDTYHEVRKELRRRYPKHPWPENP